MNVTTCNICNRPIGFGEGMFKSGIHDECYLAPKCKCGRLLYKGETFEKDGKEYCSKQCLSSQHIKNIIERDEGWRNKTLIKNNESRDYRQIGNKKDTTSGVP